MTPAAALAELRPLPPLTIDERRALLSTLRAVVLARAADAVAAANADFRRRSEMDTLLADILLVADAARHSRAKLARWARPRRQRVPYPFWPARAVLEPQPKGVIGIMAPWNYPIQLALMPAIDAIAAGNRVVVKPSEHAPRCADLLAEMLATLGDAARCVQGDATVAADFAAQPWDHLVFTGGTATGAKVMAAAAPNLTPLTLELGGKCPAFVFPGANLEQAAQDILNAKAVNAGQTCVAPDTVWLIGHSLADFAAAARAAGIASETDTVQPERLARLSAGAAIDGWCATAPDDHPLHQQEIFGPLLALREGTLDQAIAATGTPLAIYLFGATAAEEAQVAARTRSGALLCDRALEYAAFHAMAFGGIGASGFGRRNGEAGFLEFSNMRARVRHGRFSLARVFDFPRTARALALARRLTSGR